MTKYVTTTADGGVTGMYDSAVRKPPADAQEVSDADFQQLGPGKGYLNGAVINYTPPPIALTPDQQAVALRNSGLTITCSSNSTLDGTYACDTATVGFIQAEIMSLVKNGVFADGSSSVDWPDTAKALHTFNAAEFEAFAAAVGVFVAQIRKCLIGVSGAALPSSTATIA